MRGFRPGGCGLLAAIGYPPALMAFKNRLTIIGGGNMGAAVATGAIAAEVLKADEITIIEPDEGKHAHLRKLGVHVLARAPEGSDSLRLGDRRLLAVKPQIFPALARELTQLSALSGALVMSIMAGVTLDRLRAALPGARGCVRLMPSLPASVGQAVTALTFDPAAAPSVDDLEFANQLFSGVGTVMHLPEHLMDAFTALAGSGPGYVYYLAEAMCAGALRLGFSAEQADLIVRQTLLGASLLLAGSEQTPAELRAAVTSKGGTTAAAVSVLDGAGAPGAIAHALQAARDRGRELSLS